MTSPNPNLPSERPATVTDAQREAVAQALSAHFANDRLTIDTLDARMAMVYEATTLVQLEGALAGLDLTPRDDTDPGRPVLTAPEEIVPLRSVAMAVMGGFEAKGSWVMPRELQVTAIMGGGVLDLREARFGAGVSQVHVAIASRCPAWTRACSTPPHRCSGFVVSLSWAGSTSRCAVRPRRCSSATKRRSSACATVGAVPCRAATPARQLARPSSRALKGALRGRWAAPLDRRGATARGARSRRARSGGRPRRPDPPPRAAAAPPWRR